MENKEMTFVVLSTDMANAVLGYLSSRPFAEVADLVTAFRTDVSKNVEQFTIQQKQNPIPGELAAKMMKEAGIEASFGDKKATIASDKDIEKAKAALKAKADAEVANEGNTASAPAAQ
jgi:hypothetical protein